MWNSWVLLLTTIKNIFIEVTWHLKYFHSKAITSNAMSLVRELYYIYCKLLSNNFCLNLHFRLNGSPPFMGKNMKSIVEKTRNEKIHFNKNN